MDLKKIGNFMDISAVKADADMKEIDTMISLVKQYNCICASPMAWAARYTAEALKGTDSLVTGVVGFPSGAESTASKVSAAKNAIADGCREIDMVMNISAFKSKMYDYVRDDIKAVTEAAQGLPVKVILEIAYLTDDEIRRGSQLLVSAGAAYVKTGTGWADKPTTVETIKIIKKEIGGAAFIKAAGGVKDLAVMIAMYEAGCNRFGIGVRTARNILEQSRNALKNNVTV